MSHAAAKCCNVCWCHQKYHLSEYNSCSPQWYIVDDIVNYQDTTAIMKWDPDSDELPKRKNLPSIEGAPAGAAWFWGKEDQVYSSLVDDPRSAADKFPDRTLESSHTSACLFSSKVDYHRGGGES